MKARVKATGYIVDVELSHYIGDVAWYITKCHASYPENELEFIDKPQDYWACLEHRYAGMAMQGILSNQDYCRLLIDENNKGSFAEDVSRCASDFAHVLVEKMKEKEERK